jgi:Tfp pilus assembly protein PilZ
MTDAPDDKRTTPRIQPFVAPCRVVESARRFSGYVTDLSERGAQVTCSPLPSPEGTLVVLEVRLLASPTRLSLPGRIQWVRPAAGGDGHQFGVTFAGLDAGSQADLRAVLEEFQLRAAQLQ